jgi:selenocysteine-specific elongation factor
VVDVSFGKGTPVFVSRARLDDMGAKVLAVVREQHARRPLRTWVPRAELKHGLGQVEDAVIEASLRALESAEKVVRAKDLVRDVAHEVKLSEDEQSLAAELERIFLESGFVTPSRDEALAQAGGFAKRDPARAKAVFDHLIEQGALVQVQEEILFHREKYEEARKRVIDGIARDGVLLSSTFKDEIGSTRKYVIPLLEHFDEIGLTSREGDGRVMRKAR